MPDRHGRGAFYTPADVATSLVAVTVERGPVVDPACGAGVFLLAAGIRLAERGANPRDVATAQLFGTDTDPVAVHLTRCALAGWAGVEPSEVVGVVEADPLVAGRSSWPTAAGVGFGAVVGNPPFLGQLRAGTAFDDDRRRELRERFPDLVGAYTDVAWLFLALGADLLPRGAGCRSSNRNPCCRHATLRPSAASCSDVEGSTPSGSTVRVSSTAARPCVHRCSNERRLVARK